MLSGFAGTLAAMTTTDARPTDPRPLYARAMDQADTLVRDTRPDQFDLPTPCDEFDVRALLGHLVAVARRVAHVAGGGDALEIPHVVPDLADPAAAFAEAGRAADRAWADDAVLDTVLRLPFGELPGRAALLAYAQELTMHAWDLARATGRESTLDVELGVFALETAQRFVPAEPRGGRIPFGPVVPVPADAGPYARLAGHLGRTP